MLTLNKSFSGRGKSSSFSLEKQKWRRSLKFFPLQRHSLSVRLELGRSALGFPCEILHLMVVFLCSYDLYSNFNSSNTV